ncbi:photosystem II cytochrome c-550 [Halomicronema hongdechloris]|nr:photosystem II cytochrome c-550 [Halomicronema hongdechloris]
MTDTLKDRILQRFFAAVGLLSVLGLLFVGGSVLAVEISESARTVPLDETGNMITLTEQQYVNGQNEFRKTCASCHVDGITKTNPDINLGSEALALATPPRDNLQGIVDYLRHPTTYDGMDSLEELHPSVTRPDLFPNMKNLTEEDLVDISGYILSQPNILGYRWASGKPGR